MDAKKRFFGGEVFLALVGGVLLLFHFLHLYPAVNWYVWIAIVLILMGILLITTIIETRRTILADRKHLFYAILFLPGLFQIFVGCAWIAVVLKCSIYIETFFEATAVLCFAIGFLMLRKFKKSFGSRP